MIKTMIKRLIYRSVWWRLKRALSWFFPLFYILKTQTYNTIEHFIIWWFIDDSYHPLKMPLLIIMIAFCKSQAEVRGEQY